MRVSGQLAMSVRSEVVRLAELAPHHPEFQRRYARFYMLSEGSMLEGLITLDDEWMSAKWAQLVEQAQVWDRWFQTSEFTHVLDRTAGVEPF